MDANFDFEEEELIENRLKGFCTAKELSEFYLRVSVDKEFAEKVELSRKAYLVVDRAVYEKKIRAMSNAAIRELNVIPWRTRPVLLGFGTLLAACAGFILFLSFAPLNLPPNLQEMNAVRNMSRNHESDSSGSLSMQKKQAFLLFFEAQSALAEGNTQSAVLKLEELSRIKDLRPYFQEAVKWHLVVGHLENGNVARAKEIYEKLGPPQEYNINLLERWKIWWHLQKAH